MEHQVFRASSSRLGQLQPGFGETPAFLLPIHTACYRISFLDGVSPSLLPNHNMRTINPMMYTYIYIYNQIIRLYNICHLFQPYNKPPFPPPAFSLRVSSRRGGRGHGGRRATAPGAHAHAPGGAWAWGFAVHALIGLAGGKNGGIRGIRTLGGSTGHAVA